MTNCKNCGHEIEEGAKHHKATGKPFRYYHILKGTFPNGDSFKTCVIKCPSGDNCEEPQP